MGDKKIMTIAPSEMGVAVGCEERFKIKTHNGVRIISYGYSQPWLLKDGDDMRKPFPPELKNTFYITSVDIAIKFRRADILAPGKPVRATLPNGRTLEIGVYGLSSYKGVFQG
jgi:hypothetical protein